MRSAALIPPAVDMPHIDVQKTTAWTHGTSGEKTVTLGSATTIMELWWEKILDYETDWAEHQTKNDHQELVLLLVICVFGA